MPKKQTTQKSAPKKSNNKKTSYKKNCTNKRITTEVNGYQYIIFGIGLLAIIAIAIATSTAIVSAIN